MKILAIGDIHLGRTASRLPPELAQRAKQFGPAEAWRRSVELALDRNVRAVLLAGDVVEREGDFFEGFNELSKGVRRLSEAGVQVIGIAGNHDVKVLPRLAEQIPGFLLLGAGGEWQCVEIVQGDESLTLWGWSFPQPKVTANPLPDTPFANEPGIRLGLLHCDRDAGSSPYAPVTRLELDRAGLDGWLLGHIHKPDNLSAELLCGYLGSLTGMDPGEPGAHGPWLIDISSGRVARVEHIPLAPLRFEPIEVDLSGIAGPVEVKDRLVAAIRALDARIAAGSSTADAIGLRVALTGRTRFGSAADMEISPDDRQDIYRSADGRRYFIEKLQTRTLPEIDLRELAKRPNPPGMLARRLLWLDRPAGHAERDQLVERALEHLAEEARKGIWGGLQDSAPTELDATRWLRDAGLRALERLLAQTEATA